MILEVCVFVCLLIAAYLVSGMTRKASTTYDEVYIAQFNPTCVADIQKFFKCTKLNELKINIYIDFTLNNVRGTRNLHRVGKRDLNVYQKALSYLMEGFGNKNIPIDLYGFGDLESQDSEVFSMTMYHHSLTASEAIENYNSIVESIEMSGPRSFCPALKHAIDQSQTSGQHLLFIITSGLPEDLIINFEHLVESSWHDVLVIIIGVGDGPWNGMSRLTRCTSEKKFSNASYLLFDMYSEEVDFLRNIVMTAKDLNENLVVDRLKMESSGHEKDE